MKPSDFDYKFPEELIAQHPLPERTASKMMTVDRATGKWEHGRITDLPKLLKAGDVLVVNDSRVIPARIFGNLKGGKPIELLLVERITPHPHPLPQGERVNPPRPPLCKGGMGGFKTEKWRCIIKRTRNYHRGDKFFFGISATAEVVGREDDFLIVEFSKGHCERAIERCGVPPLPPYIKREGYKSYSEEDRARYQTIYAKEPGSVAAPTAGLHFSDDLVKKIEDADVTISHVTLHVGADTFAPVRAQNVEEHKMHGEIFSISEETAEIINRAKKESRRVIAVGTTTVRALESAVKDDMNPLKKSTRSVIASETKQSHGIATAPPGPRNDFFRGFDMIQSGKMRTNLFVTPGYKFQIVDALLTNFHQPKSTLLMLVSAFAGRELILSAYQDAIKNSYRLFSYGDCMLIT